MRIGCTGWVAALDRLGAAMRKGAKGVFLVFLASALVVSGCSDSGDDAAIPPAEPKAGSWRTWVLRSPDQVSIPAPPRPGSPEDRAEIAELERLSEARTPKVAEQVHRWGDYPATGPWTRLTMEAVAEHEKTSPRAARAHALVAVAVNDAVVSAWHWKYVYGREPPKGSEPVLPAGRDPSYPSEHAAIAGAASTVLAFLFPEREPMYDQLAAEAASFRVAGGTNYRRDVEAGLGLGRSVADAVIAHAKTDGSDASWDGQRPRGPGVWEPPPEVAAGQAEPVEPTAGRWRTWSVRVAQVRARSPHALDAPELSLEVDDIVDVSRRLADEQRRIATSWLSERPPPTIWNRIALDEVGRTPRLSTPRLASGSALLNTALFDASVAAWNAKYTYWTPRPVNVIRTLGIDPNWRPFVPTPVSPSYVSEHAAYAGAAAEILGDLFPNDAEALRSRAQEAAVAGFYGGIHFTSDNKEGLDLGRRVARQILNQA